VTAVAPDSVATAAREPAAQAPSRSLVQVVVDALSSMKLAVVLLVLLGLLTWLGTLAQVERGLWDVQREYFESWFVIAKLPVSWWGEAWQLADGAQFNLRIPLPGAYPVMALLFLNLLVGGFVRLRWQWRNAGVLITHVGIALLLVAGFVKLEFSYSGYLALFEAPKAGARPVAGQVSESTSFVSFHEFELALLRDLGDRIEERTIHESALAGAKGGRVVIAPAELPFRIEVHDWLDNCRPTLKGPNVPSAMPVVDGVFLRELPLLKEREANTAGCYVAVTTRDGQRVAGILYGLETKPHHDTRMPFTFTVEGQRYGLDLRRIVYDLPFAVRLDEFRKTDHPGTTMPRDFRSFVTVREGGADRPQQIYMNNPLRKDGYVLFQTNWGPQGGGGPPWYSVFEVSNNPSDVWPTIACFVIAIGLVWHFLVKLNRFLGSSTRKAMLS
jgi:hypothetical protein